MRERDGNLSKGQRMDDLLQILQQRYAMGDALDADRARFIVSQVINDMLTDAYPFYVRLLDESMIGTTVQEWDQAGIFADVMSATIRSHLRSRERVARMIVDRFLATSRNRIFLDTGEIVPLLAVSLSVGLEIRRVIPETAFVWLEEVES